MTRIILITGKYKNENGKEEFLTSHGINSETLENVVVEQVHPQLLGGVFDTELGEWVLNTP